MSSTTTARTRFDGLFKSITLSASEGGPGWEDPAARDWLQDCRGFLAHWSTLKRGKPMPSTEEFLDAPSIAYASQAYIVELIGDVTLVRLQGTALEARWGRNLTGHDFFPGRTDRFAGSASANMHMVVTHPCGLLARTSYATTKGRQITSDWIQLPLGVKAGRPPRVVGAVFQSEATSDDYTETATSYFKSHKLEWLDTGNGVPAQPPMAILDP